MTPQTTYENIKEQLADIRGGEKCWSRHFAYPGIVVTTEPVKHISSVPVRPFTSVPHKEVKTIYFLILNKCYSKIKLSKKKKKRKKL